MSTDSANTAKHVYINQIQPGMKNINATFIVLDIGPVHRTQQGSDVRTARIADQSGSINLCLWNEQSEHVTLRKVFSIRNGFATLHKGRLSLSFAKSGEISKALDTSIPYSETPDMSVYNAENDARPSLKRPAAPMNCVAAAVVCGDEDVTAGAQTTCGEALSRKPIIMDPNKLITINQLQPNMKGVSLVFIVIDIGNPRQTSQGNEVRTIRVADPTGSVVMSVWNELGEFVQPGDILRLRSANVTVFKGCMSLQVSKSGDVHKTGEFFMLYNELPDMSAYNKDLAASEVGATAAAPPAATITGGAPPPAKMSREELPITPAK